MNNLLVHQMFLDSFPKNKLHLIFADTRPVSCLCIRILELATKTHLRPVGLIQ